MSIVSNIKKRFIYIILSVFSIFLTGFIFLSSFELFFDKDISFLDSFNRSEVSNILNYVVNQSIDKQYYFSIDTFANKRKLEFIEMPSISKKLEISRAINNDNNWYVKGNKANYFFVIQKDKSSSLVFYMPESWRTIGSVSNLKAGDLIYITTDDEWSYIFRIENIEQLSNDERFSSDPYEETSLQIIIYKEDTFGYSLIQAKLINSRGTE